MPDYWRSAGYELLEPSPGGGLGITEAFLAAYLARPEMAPVAESCAAERALHQTLLADPRRPVTAVHLVAIRDKDARENYEMFARWRDWLVRHETAEGAYLALFHGDAPRFPPLFVDQLAAVLTRHVLGEAPDPFAARAGELFYRPQQIAIEDGAILAADVETIEIQAATGGFGGLGRLVVEAGTRPRRADLDILRAENADTYWERSERFDMVLDLSFARPGLDALCRLLEGWVRHFLAVEVSIQPVQRIRDERWVWHVGLDSEASAILNDMYTGATVGDDRLHRILSLFRLAFREPAAMLNRVAGRPVYLALAMTESKRLRLKPQNLLVNLPLKPKA
ncbi:MAG: hypothetical protein KIT16_01535 [Rhodospirillaceae bacterium]|nr:hypothetical protein [Rhodospirillaceae bacterium]